MPFALQPFQAKQSRRVPVKNQCVGLRSLLPLLEQNKLQLYRLLLVFVTGANNLMDFILTVLTVYVLA